MRIFYAIAVFVLILTAAMLMGGAPLSADELSKKDKSAQAVIQKAKKDKSERQGESEASPISDEARGFLASPSGSSRVTLSIPSPLWNHGSARPLQWFLKPCGTGTVGRIMNHTPRRLTRPNCFEAISRLFPTG